MTFLARNLYLVIGQYLHLLIGKIVVDNLTVKPLGLDGKRLILGVEGDAVVMEDVIERRACQQMLVVGFLAYVFVEQRDFLLLLLGQFVEFRWLCLHLHLLQGILVPALVALVIETIGA